MQTDRFEIFDPFLSEEMAHEMVRMCEGFGSYGVYGRERIRDGLGKGLAQRHDAAMNFINTGGRLGREEPLEVLAARTNYFRETYAYWNDVRLPGIEPFMFHEGLFEAARKVSDRPIIAPGIVYANILVAGQELAVHTDVAEFRGAHRTNDPEWLMVVMHHSGLFEHWRMHIVTAVSYFGECRGGAFLFYPGGTEGPPKTLPAKHNTAILLDSDSIFHGVERVADDGQSFPAIRPGMQLTFEGDESWRVGTGNETLARFRSDQIRFSVSWKAYCYADEAERRTLEAHTDDLTREQIVDTLVSDLRERGRIGDALPDETELALVMIDEYIHFPPASPEDSATPI